MFLLRVLPFWILPNIASVAALTFGSFVVLMCYGGGFGTMPAFAADYFGPKNVGPIYGLMLTAWGFASAFGPCSSRTCAKQPDRIVARFMSSPVSWRFQLCCRS